MSRLLNIFFALAFLAACTRSEPDHGPAGTEIRLGQGGFSSRIVDEDNLASEQVINNISVFFTDPSDEQIVYKYIFPGFTTSGDYRVVTIPLEAGVLGKKDIYVVTNYDDRAALEAVTTVTELEELRTPRVDKTNNLETGDGFCMYGMTSGFDFTDSSLGSPVVNVERTCAKMRITVTFPDNPRLSTDNSYLIARAASYTYLRENAGTALATGDYFNFASEQPLTLAGTAFTANAYVYEATRAPVLYIYTHINGSAAAQEYSANLPIPDRNYLYDIDVRIYEDGLITGRSLRAETRVGIYSCTNGEKVGELIL